MHTYVTVCVYIPCLERRSGDGLTEGVGWEFIWWTVAVLHVPEVLVVWVTVTVGDVVDVSGTCNEPINMYVHYGNVSLS